MQINGELHDEHANILTPFWQCKINCTLQSRFFQFIRLQQYNCHQCHLTNFANSVNKGILAQHDRIWVEAAAGWIHYCWTDYQRVEFVLAVRISSPLWFYYQETDMEAPFLWGVHCLQEVQSFMAQLLHILSQFSKNGTPNMHVGPNELPISVQSISVNLPFISALTSMRILFQLSRGSGICSRFKNKCPEDWRSSRHDLRMLPLFQRISLHNQGMYADWCLEGEVPILVKLGLRS